MPQPKWIWQCDRVIPSDTTAGRQLLDEVLTQLKNARWGQRDVFGVHLAMEEALVNAIKHGNRLDADKRVHVNCRVSNELVRIQITDEGPGFDPNALPDPRDPQRLQRPGGRGVLLMRAFMTRVEHNPSGNSVLLEKRRSRPK